MYGDRRYRYGRRLAEVLLPDGRSLNQELIKAGLAWWFRKYSKGRSAAGAAVGVAKRLFYSMKYVVIFLEVKGEATTPRAIF